MIQAENLTHLKNYLLQRNGPELRTKEKHVPALKCGSPPCSVDHVCLPQPLSYPLINSQDLTYSFSSVTG